MSLPADFRSLPVVPTATVQAISIRQFGTFMTTLHWPTIAKLEGKLFTGCSLTATLSLAPGRQSLSGELIQQKNHLKGSKKLCLPFKVRSGLSKFSPEFTESSSKFQTCTQPPETTELKRQKARLLAPFNWH